MSNRAPAWFEQKYVDGVTHKIQSMGNLLQGTTRPPDRKNGKTVIWKISGSGEATQRSAAAESVSVMNLDRSTVQQDMQDWEANDYIDLYDLAKMSENEQAETQKSGAMAIGRRKDRIVMEELNAQATAGGVVTIGNGAAAISILDIISARDTIVDIGLGSYELYCALPVLFMSQLSLYREFANSQWAGADLPLMKQVGSKSWGGVHFVPLPSNFFNVPAANQLDAYLWVKDAVGQAVAMEWQSRIDYLPEKKKWLAANDISACAKVILPEGVVRLRFATNVALTRPNP